MTNQTTTRRVAGAIDTAAAVLACHRAIVRDLDAALPVKHGDRTITTRAELRQAISTIATEKKALFTGNSAESDSLS